MNLTIRLNRVGTVITMAICLAALGACQEYGPVATSLTFTQATSLQSNHGWVDFTPGTVLNAEAKLKDDKIYLNFGDNEVVFKGASFDKNQEIFEVPFDKSEQSTRSGERLGAKFDRDQYCQPNCSDAQYFEQDQTCTYFERRPVERCRRGRRGTECSIEWQDVPMNGWQRVRVTDTSHHFVVHGEITGETSGSLASGAGTYDEVERDVEAISPCR